MSHTFQVTISDEEYKAFNLIAPDADEWVEHAIRNKVRKCLIYVAERVSQSPETHLDPQDIAAIQAGMIARGDLMKSPKNWSIETKKLIVASTKMKSRKERDMEELARMR